MFSQLEKPTFSNIAASYVGICEQCHLLGHEAMLSGRCLPVFGGTMMNFFKA
jgi:hypothetical protein